MKGNLGKVTKTIEASSTFAVGHLAIAAATENGETATIGDDIFEVDTVGDESTITTGNIAVDLSGGSTVASQGTLTIAEPVTADDTMTIGASVYTFKAGATAVVLEIGLGADEAATKLAIVAAINGTDGFNTANASVTAAAFATDDCVLTAIVPGTVGDAIVSTETFTHGSNIFDATTLGTTTAGVDPTAGESVTAFAAAFLTLPTLEAYAEGSTGVTVIETVDNGGPSAVSETLAGGSNAWEASTLIGKAEPQFRNSNLAGMVTRAATSAEVTSGFMTFGLGTDVVSVLIQVRTAAGVVKAWDGAVTLSGRSVRISNAGSVDWANTDIVTLLVAF